MRLTRFAFILFTLVWLAYPTLGQQYNFRNWTLEQGLPQSQINDVIQAQSGHLWIATRGGLSRFDGQQFYTFTKEDGLSSNNISALFQDKQRNIWIGTSDHGLIKYDGIRFTLYGHENGLKANTIYDISGDNLGKVWLATNEGIYTIAQGKLAKFKALPEQAYTTILVTANNTVWAGSQTDGLHQISAKSVSHYTTENSALPSNQITALFRHKNGDLWIGTADGVAKLNPDTALRLFNLPINRINLMVSSFVQDTYGNIWIALAQNGLIKYDGKTFTHLTRYNGLRSKRINTLATDVEGNIWIGTNGYGLQQFSSPWFVHYFEFSDLNEPRVTAITTANNGRVWIGTDEGNTAYLDGGRLNWNLKPAWAEGTSVHHIALTDNHNSWVATSNGLWHLSPTTVTQYTTKQGLPANNIYQCLPEENGSIWLATDNGISCYSEGKFKNFSPPDEAQQALKVYTLFKDSKERIWAGTANGIYTVHDGELHRAKELSGLELEEVTSIAEDKQGVLYFGAFNYGIAVLNERWEEPKLFTKAEGLPNEGIKGLYIDTKDNLWVGTSRNVLKLLLPQLREHQKISYRSYSGANGFRGIEISQNAMAQAPDGNLWFGTTKGVTKFIPALERRNKVYPKASLNAIQLFQKPTDWKQLGYATDSLSGLPLNLRLPHTQNHLTFNFHAICLSGPDQVKYKYRLAGYEKLWSAATDQSYATYSNLTPGSYTFELLAQNNDGYWTPQPLIYTFSVVPPIWRREWFVGVLLLVVAGAVLSIVKLRERSLVKMNTLLEMRVNHRTRLLERKNREKEMLLQEIHHRVKNNLQIVISMLNLQARHVQDPQAVDVMRSLKSRVRSMAILHERLYRHDDIGEIDLDDYFRGICESLYEAYGVSEDQVQLELSIPPIKVNIDTAITLGLIVNELVSNSLKYAFPDFKRKGLLRITLEAQQNGRCILTVSDNGEGLPIDFEQKKKKSFGLQLVSSLSKKMNGNLEYQNNNGTKTILFFVLPS